MDSRMHNEKPLQNLVIHQALSQGKQLNGALPSGIHIAEDQEIIRLLILDVVPAVLFVRLEKLILTHSVPVEQVRGNYIVLLVNRPEVTQCQRPVVVGSVQRSPNTVLRYSFQLIFEEQTKPEQLSLTHLIMSNCLSLK